MRFPVSTLLAYFAGGINQETRLKEFPFLEREDLVEALAAE